MRAFTSLFFATLLTLQAQSTLPVSGVEVPELAVFDRAMVDLITKYKLPGGSLAVVDRGRLILARGYGFADREANQAVQPFHLFRLASLSKPITAVAILKLVQDGKLRLDAKLVDVLPDLQPPAGQTVDARYRNVTIQHLLHHTYGSDNGSNGGDPSFRFLDAQRAFQGAPHSITNMVRFGFGVPLQFEAGSRYSYSNLGYHYLGRVIEKVSGKTYENFCREDVLAPMGITAMRIGRPTLAQRFTDEVKYYDFDNAPTRASLLPGQTGNAPRPYGGGYLIDIAESWGGWVASSVDMMRFVMGIDGRRGLPRLLNESTVATMLARPSHVPATAATYYAMGWNARPNGSSFNYFHSGTLAGTRTYIVSFANGRAYVALFNMRPPESEAALAEGTADVFLTEIDRNLGGAFNQVTRFPERDFFPEFARETLNTSAESLVFSSQTGGAAPAPQTLNLTSSGASIFVSAAAPNAPWLRLDRTGGFTPAAIRVTADPLGLAPGEYTASINLASSDARNSPRTVRVTLRVAGEVSVRNGASLQPGPLAPGSLAAITGGGFTDASSARLGGADLTLLDRSATRLRFVVPDTTPIGPAVFTVRSGDAEVTSEVAIEAVAPGLFSADRSGLGVALAASVVTAEDGTETATPVYTCSDAGECTANPIEAAGNQVLRLTATGIRGHAGVATLSAKIGDLDVEVTGAVAGENPGEDVVTIKVPAELAGRGEVDVTIAAGERRSNAVKVSFR